MTYRVRVLGLSPLIRIALVPGGTLFGDDKYDFIII